MRVENIQLGRVDLRLIARHRRLVLRDQESLVVHLLMRDRILLVQGHVARQIRLGLGIEGGVLGELALRLGELALCLIERSLQGAGINFKEDLPFVDLAAFFVILANEITGDLRLNLCVYVTVRGGDPFANQWHVLLLRRGDLNRKRTLGGRCAGRRARWLASRKQKWSKKELFLISLKVCCNMALYWGALTQGCRVVRLVSSS